MSKKPYKELNNLVKSYEEKPIDNAFVYDAFEIMKASEPKLKDDLARISVKPSPVSFARGNYHYSTKELFIYLNEIETSYLNDSQKLDACITMISHLIEHARSFQKFQNSDDDIESFVTGLCFNIDPNTNKVIQVDCTEGHKPLSAFLYSPVERIASIRAAEFFVNLVKDRKNQEALEDARSVLSDIYLKGYINNGYFLNPPTYNYLIERRDPETLKVLDKMVNDNKYDLYTRVLCGLPIKLDEIDTIETGIARAKIYLSTDKTSNEK
jgi:hypothetical protein